MTPVADLREVACAPLLEQQRQEMDLEEHVAELIEQAAIVAAVGRVGEFVGLLERVRDDRALILLPVPGTLDTQPARDRVEALQRPSDLRAAGAHAVGVGHFVEFDEDDDVVGVAVVAVAVAEDVLEVAADDVVVVVVVVAGAL